MKKIGYAWLCAATMLALGMSSCSSNDLEITNGPNETELSESSLIGRWSLTEIQDGPVSLRDKTLDELGFPSGAIVEFREDKKVVFHYSDGTSETTDYDFPKHPENYNMTSPIVLIGNEVPFSYKMTNSCLRLHYGGIATCDHIPATFNFVRLMTDDQTYFDNVNLNSYTLFISSAINQQERGAAYHPHCYKLKGEMVSDEGTRPYAQLSFSCGIKYSNVFDQLGISFEDDSPIKDFEDLKVGDTFDSSQFHASASYFPTWEEEVARFTNVISGYFTVLNKKTVNEKDYITIYVDMKFDAIDKSCVYNVSGTIDYMIENLQFPEES